MFVISQVTGLLYTVIEYTAYSLRLCLIVLEVLHRQPVLL